MTQGQPRVAAFDVDGTLTTRDCVVPFLRRVGGTLPLVGRLLVDARRTVPAVVRRDRDALKAAAAEACFAGRALPEVGREAAEFARMVRSEWLRPDTLELFDRHLAGSDDVVLVSASFEVYLRPLGGLLGVDGVLGTRLAAGTEGVLTGELDGPNCRGPEKVRRLHDWLDERHGDRGGRSGVHLTAYGDSVGDRELLADADEAIYVGSGHPNWLT